MGHKEVVVRKHWAHQRLAQNLLTASRAKAEEEIKLQHLLAAAGQWQLERLINLEEASGWRNCHLCGKDIRAYVLLFNPINQVRIIIGHNCYDKLLHLIRKSVVESTLVSRSEHSSSVRKHWRELRDSLPGKPTNETVVGWLKEQLAEGEIPAEVSSIVAMMSQTRYGLPFSKEEADRVIEFYKETRRFPIGVLFRPWEISGFCHCNLLPTEITINQIDRVRQIFSRMGEIEEKWSKAARRREQESEWQSLRQRAFQILATYSERIEIGLGEGAKTKDVEAARLDLDQVRESLSEILSESFVEDDNDRRRRECRVNQLVCELGENISWRLTRTEPLLYVKTTNSIWDYVLVHRGGRWVKLSGLREQHAADGVEFKTGLYAGRVREFGGIYGTMIALQKELNSDGVIVDLEFSVPSRQHPGEYVAKHQGKVVLPSKPIRIKRTYKVFLTGHGDDSRYYRAWII